MRLKWKDGNGARWVSCGDFDACVFRGVGGYYYWIRRKYQRRTTVTHRGPVAEDTAIDRVEKSLKRRCPEAFSGALHPEARP